MNNQPLPMAGKGYLYKSLDAPKGYVECGISTFTGYGVSNSLSNTVYSSQQINTVVHDKESPDFNLLSDKEYSDKEEEEVMAETMEQYISKTLTDYGSGVARPKINNKDQFELKGQFLKELRENTFSGSDNEDANEHIEKVLLMLHSLLRKSLENS
ncbi:hypothetical protein Tco_0016308 [Tanacetum coccineum]